MDSKWFAASLLLLLCFSASLSRPCDAQAEASSPVEHIESFRIAALWSEIQSGDHAAQERFWEEMKDKAPLWENIPPRNMGEALMTFVWRGTESTRKVVLEGTLPNPEMERQLVHLPNTDLWYRTERLPIDSRFTYDFVVTEEVGGKLERQERLDPLNPRSFNGGSVGEFLLAPPQLWVERGPNVPAGKVASHEIYSSILDDERDFTLYVPAKYKAKGPPCGLLVIFDGQNYTSLIPAPTILDNLIAQGRIPPLIAVMVASNGKHRTISRTSDLTCNPDFADFVVKELVPWVRARYNITTAPNHAIVCGESLGGLEATYIGFHYPDVFGNVLSFSGSFFYFRGWPNVEATYSTQTGWLTTQFATTPRKPLRLYLTTGTFEGDGLTENRRMRDVLIAKGYPITYSEYNGGHDQFCWRGLLASGLLALVGEPARTARRISATRTK